MSLGSNSTVLDDGGCSGEGGGGGGGGREGGGEHGVVCVHVPTGAPASFVPAATKVHSTHVQSDATTLSTTVATPQEGRSTHTASWASTHEPKPSLSVHGVPVDSKK